MPIVYQGRVFSVEVDRVRFPDGREHAVEVVHHRPSVVVIPMPDTTHVVLVSQYRHSLARMTWELPAGGIKDGEAEADAARRECGEETGLVPARLRRLQGLFPAPGFCDEELVFFAASDLQAVPPGAYTADDDETIETRIVTIAEARAMVARGAIVDLKTAYGLTLVQG